MWQKLQSKTSFLFAKISKQPKLCHIETFLKLNFLCIFLNSSQGQLQGVQNLYPIFFCCIGRIRVECLMKILTVWKDNPTFISNIFFLSFIGSFIFKSFILIHSFVVSFPSAILFTVTSWTILAFSCFSLSFHMCFKGTSLSRACFFFTNAHDACTVKLRTEWIRSSLVIFNNVQKH